jgi:glycosyltransferase involved in cell wall biosynthesis
VATDLIGLRALVEHGTTGLRVPPGDSVALARTILELLGNPTRTRTLGLAGRETIRRDFDPATEVEQLATLYRRGATDVPATVTPHAPHVTPCTPRVS